MRHKVGFNRLDRKQSHRKAMLRNMAISLLRYERIETTKAKALEVRKVVEKMITRAKTDSVHDRRIIAKDVNDKAVLNKLFTEISPMFAERKGGYTRILKTGLRKGDAAEMVILELVEKTAAPEKAAKAKKDKKAENTKEKQQAEKLVEEKVVEEATEVVETVEAVEAVEEEAEKTE
ncbi:MAG: 50S ribosomal protein L17 [Bacteroidetes bacterium]|nr:50S ribosomal protein L17 [Bacteroidota bacterium]